VRSTTGAYGDFPEYYYKPGNQFGAYLLGRTPSMSWDTRKELGLRDGEGPPVSVPRGRANGGPRPQAHKPTPKLTPHDILMAYIRASVSPDGAAWILVELAAARGVSAAGLAGNDVYQRLDAFAIAHLTDEQQVEVLRRLRLAVDEARKSARPKAKPRRERRDQPKQKRRETKKAPKATARDRAPDRPRTQSAATGRCALCNEVLSPQERRASELDASIFLGHLYCSDHAAKVRAALGKA
jgi:hypothetical protein